MKSLVLGSAALIVIGMSIPTHAADMAVKAPPPPAPAAPYNWSGLYVGGNFGGAWTSGNLNIPGNNFYGGLTEFIAGVQAGYNVQAGHFLFGVEGDFDWATFDHPTLPFPTLGSVSQHWIGTAAGRIRRRRPQASRPSCSTRSKFGRKRSPRRCCVPSQRPICRRQAKDRPPNRSVRKLDFGYGARGVVESRCANGQSRHQLQVRERHFRCDGRDKPRVFSRAFGR